MSGGATGGFRLNHFSNEESDDEFDEDDDDFDKDDGEELGNDVIEDNDSCPDYSDLKHGMEGGLWPAGLDVSAKSNCKGAHLQ